MTGRRHIGFVAAAATLLAAMPLSTVFESWTWFVRCVITVVFVAGGATLARSLRGPAWAQLGAMLGALLVALTFLTRDSEAFLGLVPTTATFARFAQLLNEAGTGMRELGVPVGDHDGLLFLTTAGVGLVAVCVDLFAVALRRPALAGLPMLAIYSVPVAVRQDSVSIIPFIAGAAGFLWLLVVDNVERVRRFGRRFTGDGRDIDMWEPSPLAAAGRRLAIVGVVAAVALPVAVPGMTTGLMNRFGSGREGVCVSGECRGSGRQVNLWAVLEGTLKQDEEIEMLRVTNDDPALGYLRLGVADELGMNGFRNRPPAGRQPATRLSDPRSGRDAVAFYQGRATVDIVSLKMNLLPVYADPVTITRGIDSRWFYDPRMQVIYSTSADTLGKRYEFEYARGEYSVEGLRRAGAPPEEIVRANTPVPGVRQVEDEVARLTSGKTTDYDKVRALYDFFSAENNFTYSLEAESQTGAPAIVEFLARRSGYCVQYAAALAWMVRQAGIPARVAFGFTRGSKGEDNTYTLTNRNLHAWTEVYFEGSGWVPFDATPSSYIPGSVDPAWAPDPDAPEVSGPGADSSAGPGGASDLDPGNRGPDGGGLLPEDESGFDPAGAPGQQSSRWPGYLALGALVLVLLLATPAIRRALVRRRRRPAAGAAGVAVAAGQAPPGEPSVVVAGGPAFARARHDAHAAWDELIDTLVDFRLPVDAAETPRTTAERLVRDSMLRDHAAQGARLLGRAEERARYAPEPLLTSELGASLRTVRRALAGQARRRVRLAALLLPPSVLIRWRHAVVAGTTTAVTTAGRWRDTVTRTVSPRRRLLAMRPNR